MRYIDSYTVVLKVKYTKIVRFTEIRVITENIDRLIFDARRRKWLAVRQHQLIVYVGLVHHVIITVRLSCIASEADNSLQDVWMIDAKPNTGGENIADVASHEDMGCQLQVNGEKSLESLE